MSRCGLTEAADKDSMEVFGPRRIAARDPDREPCAAKAFERSGVSRPRASCCRRTRPPASGRKPIEEVVNRRRRGALRRGRAEDERNARAEMIEMRPSGGHRLAAGVFYAPTRGPDPVIRANCSTDTRGHRDHEPPVSTTTRPYQGRHPGPPQRRPDLQRSGRGPVAYAMFKLEDRGPDDDHAGSQGLQGHDRRRAHPRQRS